MWRRPLNKRQLGLLLLACGIPGLAVVLAIDALNAGREFILGPTQALLAGVILLFVIVGLSLLPLGDRPA